MTKTEETVSSVEETSLKDLVLTLKVEKNVLIDSLRKVNSCVGKFANDKHFDLAKMRCEEHGVSFYTYDGQCSLTLTNSRIETNNIDFECVFNPKLLLGGLNGMRDCTLELTINSENIEIVEKTSQQKQSSRHVSIPVMAGDQIVDGKIDAHASEHYVTKPMKFTDFIDTFKNVSEFSATDESRPILAGDHLFVKNSQLYIEATDARRAIRLASNFDINSIVCVSADDQPIDQDKWKSSFNSFNLVVDAGYFKKLEKVFSDDDIVIAEIYKNGIQITSNSENPCSFTTNSLVGSYPNMDRFFLLQESNVEINCSFLQLNDAVNTFIRTTKNNKDKQTCITVDSNTLTLNTNARATVQFKIAVDVSSNLSNFKIYVNSDYLGDLLKCCRLETAVFCVTDPLKPLYLKVKKDEYGLITPLRVN